MRDIGNNVEAFRYYLVLKSRQFQPCKIIGKTVSTLVFDIYLPFLWWAIYLHKAGNLFSIIAWWAVESLRTVIERKDSPLFIYINADRRE